MAYSTSSHTTSSSKVFWSCNFSNTSPSSLKASDGPPDFVSAPSSPTSHSQHDGNREEEEEEDNVLSTSSTPTAVGAQSSSSSSSSSSKGGQPQHHHHHHTTSYSIDRASLSSEGKRLAVMTEEALHLFDLETGESHELETPSLSSCILWAGDENLIVGR